MIGLTTLVIGDDHQVFLDALSAVLTQQDFAVTVASTVPETVAAVTRIQPDVCLLDWHFAAEDGRDEDGLAAIGEMTAAAPSTKILVLTADPDTEGVVRALSAGASGYLHKTRGVTAVVAAIRRVQRGEMVVEVPKLPQPGRPGGREAVRRMASFLTGRERQCLALLVAGRDTGEIAARLGVSPATVRTHIQSLMIKLGVHSRLEAVALAVRHQLLDDDTWGPPHRQA